MFPGGFVKTRVFGWELAHQWAPGPVAGLWPARSDRLVRRLQRQNPGQYLSGFFSWCL